MSYTLTAQYFILVWVLLSCLSLISSLIPIYLLFIHFPPPFSYPTYISSCFHSPLWHSLQRLATLQVIKTLREQTFISKPHIIPAVGLSAALQTAWAITIFIGDHVNPVEGELAVSYSYLLLPDVENGWICLCKKVWFRHCQPFWQNQSLIQDLTLNCAMCVFLMNIGLNYSQKHYVFVCHVCQQHIDA